MNGQLIEQPALSAGQREEMFRLHTRHFGGVTWSQFRTDLAEKNFAVLFHDGQKNLVGFSTLLVYETAVDGRVVTVVYSGDTIVDASARGTAALPSVWINSVRRLRPRFPAGDLYWLLIVSGFRTYRFLPVFFDQFWPRHDRPTPAAEAALLHGLAVERFGARFDPTTGVVRLEHPQPLRADAAAVPAGRLKDPDVAFFVDRNPGHAAGDELVCLASLEPSNLTRAGARMARQ